MKTAIRNVTNAVRHRGPDGIGFWYNKDGNFALGHARLSIIDLSDKASQPMVSMDGNIVLTFNGELYNYVELRSELKQIGHRFRGTSDTEVLLIAIEEWGIKEAIEKSNGMFGLALADLRNRKLWLARDRVGKKPLYLYQDSNLLVFSSEMKGILALPYIEATISRQSMADYLSLGFVIGPRTIYNEIDEVPPGTLFEYSLDDCELRRYKYWDFHELCQSQPPESDLIRTIENRFSKSINIRLRSDVPVGIFLSGGIDSGLITAFAAKQVSERLKTFTVSFGEDGFDESKLARQVAQRYGTEHHEIRLDPDISELLANVVRAYDEPFADPSALPTFAIAREASRYVKVVLNGEGSDELFGGYRRTLAMSLLQKGLPFLNLIPLNCYRTLISKLPKPGTFRSHYALLHRFFRVARRDSYNRYLKWTTDGFSETEKLHLLKPETSQITLPTNIILAQRMEPHSKRDSLSEFMAMDFLVGMADCLLPKIDIATMAHGLEGRSPFLDFKLVDFVAGLDKASLLKGMQTKPLLRSLSKKYLPPAIVKAPKRGFEIPLVKWMKSDLNPLVRETLLSNNCLLYDYFEKRHIVNLLERNQHLDDERWSKRLWLLFIFAAWGAALRENRLHNAR